MTDKSAETYTAPSDADLLDYAIGQSPDEAMAATAARLADDLTPQAILAEWQSGGARTQRLRRCIISSHVNPCPTGQAT